MERLLFGSGWEDPDFLNCSNEQYVLSVENGTNFRSKLLGIGVLIYGCAEEILYLLIMFALWKRIKIGPCYKFMFMLGIFDMIEILFSMIIGWILFRNDLCSHQTFEIKFRSIDYWLWYTAGLVCVILLFNRLCDLWSSKLVETIFLQWRQFFWLILPFIYAFVLSNPAELQSQFFVFHNIFALVGSLLLYFFFVAVYLYKCKIDKEHLISQGQAIVIFQSMVLSAVTLLPTGVYVVHHFITTPPQWLHFLGRLTWQLCPGIHAVTYLLVNPTIRRDIFEYLGVSKTTVKRVLTSQGSLPH